jgi:hypothetical protein
VFRAGPLGGELDETQTWDGEPLPL